MILAFAVPIVVGVIGGALNGAIIAGAGVNPLIVTLGTLTAYRGFVVWYRVNPIYDLQPYYRVVGQGTVLGLPIPVIDSRAGRRRRLDRSELHPLRTLRLRGRRESRGGARGRDQRRVS